MSTVSNASVPASPRYASLAEAADYSRLSIRTIQRLYSSGQLRAYQVGRRVLFTYPDLDAVIRARILPFPAATPATRPALDASGRAVALGPDEAAEVATRAVAALGGEHDAPPYDEDQAAELARLQAGLAAARGCP